MPSVVTSRSVASAATGSVNSKIADSVRCYEHRYCRHGRGREGVWVEMRRVRLRVKWLSRDLACSLMDRLGAWILWVDLPCTPMQFKLSVDIVLLCCTQELALGQAQYHD